MPSDGGKNLNGMPAPSKSQYATWSCWSTVRGTDGGQTLATQCRLGDGGEAGGLRLTQLNEFVDSGAFPPCLLCGLILLGLNDGLGLHISLAH